MSRVSEKFGNDCVELWHDRKRWCGLPLSFTRYSIVKKPGKWVKLIVDKGLFKPMVAQMIEIGMKTELAEMMDKVNEYIKMEIDESVAKFVKVLPEISYLFVGVVLIAFCITVLIPVVNVYMGGFIDMPT